MKPHTHVPHDEANRPSDIQPTRLFEAFSAERRQYALAYLAQKPAAIHINDLAEYIAIKEDQPSYDWYERILVDLNHRHLPQLADIGLIQYDSNSELVELIVDRKVVAPYLQLVDEGN
ncbi:DUF7344 domain-containing protein [Halopiger aswanensis]|uniref:DUF7344 domain-containing protein n=1 Tax=Halopiger aswanensis TaxID=148449 RepID=A0A419VXT3_9EURY|nr:hypothetical protein [Halopiger aswanensis]RKD87984.1 hypothetical protein ATJ93_4470 [Halopiger aswanensis]